MELHLLTGGGRESPAIDAERIRDCRGVLLIDRQGLRIGSYVVGREDVISGARRLTCRRLYAQGVNPVGRKLFAGERDNIAAAAAGAGCKHIAKRVDKLHLTKA